MDDSHDLVGEIVSVIYVHTFNYIPKKSKSWDAKVKGLKMQVYILSSLKKVLNIVLFNNCQVMKTTCCDNNFDFFGQSALI